MMADSARPASPDSLQMGIGVGMGMAVEVASIRRAFLGSGFGGLGVRDSGSADACPTAANKCASANKQPRPLKNQNQK